MTITLLGPCMPFPALKDRNQIAEEQKKKKRIKRLTFPATTVAKAA